jgi:hydrogenase small subunit
MRDHKIQLDEFSCPLHFYKKTIHYNCPRYSDYMDDVFAGHPGDQGCFKEIGCKGRVTYADCPTIKWNSGVSWCIEAGTPCIGCANPYFPDIEIAEV